MSIYTIGTFYNARDVAQVQSEATQKKMLLRSGTGGLTMAEWICETCIYFPPSSCDGKPCCMCEPDDPIFSCYRREEEQT